MPKRYHRLTRVGVIDAGAPQRLQQSAALIVGCGALGSATASLLARAGVGRIRLVDRDLVEEPNLADQSLYTEQDAAQRRPKAEAAAERLAALNRNVHVERWVADFAPDNARSLAAGMQVIVDGSDNLETKYLLNDVAVATGTPWVYAGCAGTQGVVLAVLPGQSHCLRCIWPQPPPPARVDGCASMGLLPTTAYLVAAIQTTEALKILLGQEEELAGGLIHVDVWTARSRKIPVPGFRSGANDCPACGRRDFAYLAGRAASQTSVMCGRETVLITLAGETFDYAAAQRRLARQFSVAGGQDYFRFQADGRQFLIFSSGRALVHGTADPLQARALCGRYLTP